MSQPSTKEHLRYYENSNTVIDLSSVTAIVLKHQYPHNHINRDNNLYEVISNGEKIEVIGAGLIHQYKAFKGLEPYEGNEEE